MRFPEFDGEWRRVSFSEIGDFFKGAGISKEQLSENGNPCILYGELYTKYKNEVIKTVISKTNIDTKGLVRSKANDIIIPSSGESAVDIATACCVNLDDILLGGDLNVIRPHGDNGNFISYQLNGKRKLDIAKVAQGSSVIHLYNNSLKNLYLYLPQKIEEQNKIAALLSAIDTKIETQNKIIKQLESSMFILREKLLTGILRYKDKSGESFPDWEQKRLADIGETYNGLSGKVKEDFGHGKPYIQYKQIFDSPKIEVKNCAFVNVSNEENQNRVKLGDVFFTISSETSREIAISSVLLNDIDEMYLNSFCFGYRPRSFEILNPYFSAHFFRSNVFRNEIVKLAQGSTRFNLAKSELMRVSVSLPSIREQVLIASALDTVEKKITTEKQLLSKYTYQKRYFLINTLV